ncbi:MAG: hypothetical protein ACKV22_00675 [Bryobacteraceae bacterium]
MLIPDFSNQPYIAEVVRTSAAATDVLSAIGRLLGDEWKHERATVDGGEILVYHGFILSPERYHRAVRTTTNPDGVEIQIPRSKIVRSREHYFYDIFVVNRSKHFIIAAPFYGVARDYFPKIDRALAGKRIVYETLNITNMVVKLGTQGRMEFPGSNDEDNSIIVTRCHLAYDDPADRRRDLEQIRLTGANLGATEIYGDLVRPVIDRKSSALVVTPVLLGFALFSDGVKKSGATTDRHGNFKVSVGPGLRQLTRLFKLLDGIEGMKTVVSVTSNVPILHSAAIEAAE